MSLTTIKFIGDKLISDKSIFGFRKFCKKIVLIFSTFAVICFCSGTRVAAGSKNYPGNLLPGYPLLPVGYPATRGSPTDDRVLCLLITHRDCKLQIEIILQCVLKLLDMPLF